MAESEEVPSGPLPASSWESNARQEQQDFFEVLGTCMYNSYRRRMPSICNLLLSGFCKCHEGDGMCVNECEMVALKMKIGFAMCGPPTSASSDENCFTGYTKDKFNCILKVFNQITKRQHSDKILISIIFISLEADDKSSNNVFNLPIFRIPNPNIEGECCFIDPAGRFYRDWNDFLKNNKLPKSECCYPKDGIYSGDSQGKVELCFGLTPAATLGAKILGGVDTTATIGTVVAGVCTFFPPVAVPGAAACGVAALYSMVRGSIELADRSRHGQSLTDREAARQWLALAGSSLGLGSAGGMAAVKLMTREGIVVSNIISRIVTGLTVSSAAVNGISIVESGMTIVEQEEWISLQSLQLVVSVVFFAHSVINFKTARSLIEQTQNQVLNDHSSGLSKRQRNLFAGMQKETLNVEQDPIIGRAKIIRELNHISNKSEFFGQILRSNKEARKNAQPVQKFKFGDFGAQDGSVHQGQTSLPQNVFLRPAAAINALPMEATSLCNTNPRYVRPHEPALVTQIRTWLQVIPQTDLYAMFNMLSQICEKFPYGRFCMSALRIVCDIYNCRTPSEAVYIIKSVLRFWEELVEEYRRTHQSRESDDSQADKNVTEDSENQQSDTEEIMNGVVEDVDFIPEHFYSLGSIDMEEEVYHFPVDHQNWGENGELTPDEYIVIAQNSFGSDSQCCNIMHQGSTANVYVEHYGLVKITSSVKDQIIILKKFKKLAG